MDLKSKLYCGDKLYRATLEKGKLGAILAVHQPIGDTYHRCGGWYLSTLLEGPRDPLCDGISIDYGQGWNIDSGMLAAINEASRIVAGEYKNADSLL